MESDLTCLCQMLKNGVEKDFIVNQKEWTQTSPTVDPSRVVLTEANHSRTDNKDDWLFVVKKMFPTQIIFKRLP